MEVKTAKIKITKTIFGSAAIFCNQQVVFVNALPTVNIRTNVLYAFNGALQSWTGLAWVTYSGGSSIHNDLSDRDAADAHPISSITGLTIALAGKQAKATYQTITIAVADWSGGVTVVKTVSGVTATSFQDYYISSDAVRSEIISSNVRPTAQGVNSITFTADSTPTTEISFDITIKEVS